MQVFACLVSSFSSSFPSLPLPLLSSQPFYFLLPSFFHHHPSRPSFIRPSHILSQECCVFALVCVCGSIIIFSSQVDLSVPHQFEYKLEKKKLFKKKLPFAEHRIIAFPQRSSSSKLHTDKDTSPTLPPQHNNDQPITAFPSRLSDRSITKKGERRKEK